jgi:hypothetical protein
MSKKIQAKLSIYFNRGGTSSSDQLSERQNLAQTSSMMTERETAEKQRLNSEISSTVQQIASVFESRSARDMTISSRSVLRNMKMHVGGPQLMDDCIDLFTKVPNLVEEQENLQQWFALVRSNITNTSQLNILVNLVLSAAPHSMVVKRAVSHYNIFRNDKRLSMRLQSVNNRLLIALNGVGTSRFDPRPAVARFLSAKQRRFREPKLESYTSRPFIKKFFRSESEVLMK